MGCETTSPASPSGIQLPWVMVKTHSLLGAESQREEKGFFLVPENNRSHQNHSLDQPPLGDGGPALLSHHGRDGCMWSGSACVHLCQGRGCARGSECQQRSVSA